MALLNNSSECAHYIRFKCEVHGEIGVLPVSQHPHAHEIGFLRVDLFMRVIAAVLSERCGGYLVAWFAHLFFNIELNRQSVAIPARHIRRIKARQGFRFDNNVFQNFVNRMPYMELTVSVGRAVMQDESRFIFARLTDLTI